MMIVRSYRSATNMLVGIFCVMLLISFNGCSFLKKDDLKLKIALPKVEVESIEIQDFNLERMKLKINMQVDNPNPVEVAILSYEYEIFVDEKRLVENKKNLNSIIAANRVSEVEFPVDIYFVKMKAIIDNLNKTNAVNYKVITKVYLDIPILGKKRIRHTYERRLPVPHIPKVSIKKFKVNSFSLLNADIELDIRVENPNEFPVEVEKLQLDFSVSNEAWAKIDYSNTLLLTPKSESTISLPINIDLRKLGHSVLAAIKQKQGLNYKIDGEIRFRTGLPLLKLIILPVIHSGGFDMNIVNK